MRGPKFCRRTVGVEATLTTRVMVPPLTRDNDNTYFVTALFARVPFVAIAMVSRGVGRIPILSPHANWELGNACIETSTEPFRRPPIVAVGHPVVDGSVVVGDVTTVDVTVRISADVA